MPRPISMRRVRFEPGVTYFKPAGVRLSTIGETVLAVDEFEAIRLNDLEDMEQGKAAKKMSISQPTFNRLIKVARKKVAEALVNGKAIRIQGGNYKMAQPRRGRGMGRGRGFRGPAASCVCTSCSYQAAKKPGVPCSTLACPKCKSPMIRGQ
ncbi:DUF134 domain-containing protein [Candidatus Woesearchaeota archaeon]|nr:DUF134 domain-containing protein [Candidatus Woesearchaeota archaeon]